jgi:hypothetical protein
MKILIAYYSRTGGTEKLASAIQKEFGKRGHAVDVEKIVPIKEHGFWGWSYIRMIKGECPIQPILIKDVSGYDAILIGSPNWTRLALPVARYLKQVQGLKYKTVGFFSTTAAPPALEWYILSAYLLDLTFSRAVEERGGRIKSSILLSSILKTWGVDSEYGERLIKSFCDDIEIPIRSVKSYFLDKRETDGIRLLVVAFSSILAFSFISQLIASILKINTINWTQYSFLGLPLLTTFLLLTLLKEKKRLVFLGQYLGGFSLVLLWTLAMSFVQPSLGRLIIWGYFLVFVSTGFFRNQKLTIFTGIITFLSYSFLFLTHPRPGVLVPQLDLTLLFISLGVVNLITMNLHRHFMDLLEAQEEIEATKNALEIKVADRTKELKEAAESLDDQVREKTRKLQEKVEELEKFNKLVVGRELKMVQLKEEVEKLQKELGDKGKR